MKLKLIPVFLLITTFITLSAGELANSQIEAQGNLRLRLPFTGIYRLTSYVDHQSPLNPGDNTIVMFNGEAYNNCPGSTEQWTTQGPYCYDGHEGIDWAMGENTPVLAAASGVINEADTGVNLGNFIIIDHGNGYETVYAHLNNFAAGLNIGDEVDAGDLIAFSGNTGNSFGPHLHFETLRNGLQTDPFGWRGDTPDPLINYSGEAAVCLWGNEWCYETMVEDGDNSNDGTEQF